MFRRGKDRRRLGARRWPTAGLAAAGLVVWIPVAAAGGWPYGAFAWAGETAVDAIQAADYWIVLAQGDRPVGGGDLPVLYLGLPNLDPAGRLGFTGRLDDGQGGDGFVWLDGEVIWRDSQAQGVDLVGAAPQLGLADEARYFFRAQIDGRDALWSDGGLVARAGVAEPLLGGAKIDLLRRPLLTAAGRSFWLAFYKGAEGKGRALFTRSAAGETTVRLRSGDEVDGGVIASPRGLDLAYDVSADGAHYVHVVELEKAGGGVLPAILLDGAVVLRAGDPAGPEETWERFRNVAVDSQGHWVMSGTTSADAESDTVLAYDGAVVVREGERVGEIDLAPQAAVTAVETDDRGRVAHLWSTGGFGPEYVLFSCDAASVADSKAILEVRGPANSGERVTAFEGTGHGSALRLGAGHVLYLWVRLERVTGETRQAVIATRLPDCPESPPAGEVSPPDGR